jgi:hypothetical protein
LFHEFHQIQEKTLSLIVWTNLSLIQKNEIKERAQLFLKTISSQQNTSLFKVFLKAVLEKNAISTLQVLKCFVEYFSDLLLEFDGEGEMPVRFFFKKKYISNMSRN